MGIHRKKSLEEMRVEAINKNSLYLWERYIVAAEGKKRKKQSKEEFEKYLKDEMSKFPLGCNPYQE